jgi:CRISPR/Cas system-associated exonuclease Cas4 (RecB family)
MKQLLLITGLILLIGCSKDNIKIPPQATGLAADVEISLSPTSLNLYQDCPHCFWLEKVKGIKRPEKGFPTLLNALDTKIKKYADDYRAKGELPPELKDKVKGRFLPDQKQMTTWRNWRTGLVYDDKGLNARLTGAFDECLLDGDVYIVADFKARGYPPKDEVSKYYQNQLNCYTLLLKANNYKIADFAYLIYYVLDDLQEEGAAKFNIEVVTVKTDTEAARKLFRDAIKTLRNGPPEPKKNCPYCRWRGDSGDITPDSK